MLIIFFLIMGNLAAIFNGYQFNRFGLNRDFVLILVWILPALASFLAVFKSKGGNILLGLSFIPIISFSGPTVHFILGELGIIIDLIGLEGVKVVFQMYLMLSLLTIGIGSTLGKLLRKKN